MKYIIIKTIEGEMSFTFPGMITHFDFAQFVEHFMMSNHVLFSYVVSAGFVNSYCFCEGESESLGIKSRSQDSIILSFGASFSNMDFDELPESLVKKLNEKLESKRDKNKNGEKSPKTEGP